MPDNPVSRLYAVAKNKTKNHFKHQQLFEEKLSPELRRHAVQVMSTEIDLSVKTSQLAMIFTICHPAIQKNCKWHLFLNLLCGFGIQEIADAYLTNKEIIYKRLQ